MERMQKRYQTAAVWFAVKMFSYSFPCLEEADDMAVQRVGMAETDELF